MRRTEMLGGCEEEGVVLLVSCFSSCFLTISPVFPSRSRELPGPFSSISSHFLHDEGV